MHLACAIITFFVEPGGSQFECKQFGFMGITVVTIE